MEVPISVENLQRVGKEAVTGLREGRIRQLGRLSRVILSHNPEAVFGRTWDLLRPNYGNIGCKLRNRGGRERKTSGGEVSWFIS
jgi:hypothetical protein